MSNTIESLWRLQHLTQQLSQQVTDILRQGQHSVPLQLHGSTLNPAAQEFVPTVVSPTITPAVPSRRFSDLLHVGETVYLTVGIGRYADGYPILSSAVAHYDGHTFHVTACDDMPSLIGRSSEKPGAILYEFIRGLKRVGKLRHEPKVSVWRHCYVKRNGKHLSFSRLSSSS